MSGCHNDLFGSEAVARMTGGKLDAVGSA